MSINGISRTGFNPQEQIQSKGADRDPSSMTKVANQPYVPEAMLDPGPLGPLVINDLGPTQPYAPGTINDPGPLSKPATKDSTRLWFSSATSHGTEDAVVSPTSLKLSSATSSRASSLFKSLGTALESGDLSSAKQAFDRIQNAHKSSAGHHKRAVKAGSDFKAISDALSADDLGAAQKAWVQFLADTKSRFNRTPTSTPGSGFMLNISA